jgi:hypothetical protein
MRLSSGVIVLATVSLVVSACAGARFEVSPALRGASTAPVVGDRPMCVSRDGAVVGTAMESLTAERRFDLGPMIALLGRPVIEQNERRPEPTTFVQTLIDLETKLGPLVEAGRAVGRATSKVAQVVPEAGTVDRGVQTAVTTLADLHEFVAVLVAWLTAPFEVAEVSTLTFVTSDGPVHAYAVCRSSNSHAPGTYTPSDFRLNCRLSTNQPGTPGFSLSMHAEGSTWLDSVFNGSLTSDAGPGWAVSSQSMRALGAGTVRGFDLWRSGRQEAAVSFWEDGVWDSASNSMRYSPRAWWFSQPSANDHAIIQTTLALLTAFPFPSACDAALMSQRVLPPQ